MNKLKLVFSGFLFMWKNRNRINNIWAEVVGVRDVIKESLKDKKVTVEELKDIIREIDDVLEAILGIEV